MKMTKLVAAISAAALAVTSLSLTAFGAASTVADVDVSIDATSSAVTSQEVKDGGESIAVKANDVVTVTYTTPAADTADAAISVNGVAAASVTASTADATVDITITTDAATLTVSADKVTISHVKVAGERTTEATTPAETTAPDEGDNEGDTATAPTVTIPSGEQTLELTANTWSGDDGEHGNYQASVSLFSGASIDSVKAMTSDVSVKINLASMSVGDGSKLNAMLILQSTGAEDEGAIWETLASGNFADASTITLSATADAIKAKMTDSVKGTVSLLVAFGTATDDAAITSAPTIKFTFGDQGSSEEPGDSTTAGGDSGFDLPGNIAAGTEPNIKPAAPSTEAVVTAAPEVVTAANGESVEAAKDVVPAGATLEVKEQTKEEAVKAVEAVKATDANKEVVETIKKAVEEAKAAVVDIDLVKDGQKVQPNGTIKVTLNVPEALKDAAKLFVYRVEADGTFTDVQAAVENGKIVFTTNHFSTYIITSEALSGDAVVTEAPAATEAPATPSNPDDKNQATGVILAVIPAVIAAAGVVVSKKRK